VLAVLGKSSLSFDEWADAHFFFLAKWQMSRFTTGFEKTPHDGML